MLGLERSGALQINHVCILHYLGEESLHGMKYKLLGTNCTAPYLTASLGECQRTHMSQSMPH